MPELLVSELELVLPLGLWLLEALGEFGLLAPVLGLELGEDCDEELLALPLSPPWMDDELELPGELLDDEPMEELVPLLIELVDPVDPEAAPPLVLSAVSVWSSILPEACRPCCCWNFFSAAFVFGPAMPSTGPALKPLSLRACWTCVTFELSLADDADEALDDGEVDEAEEDGEVDEDAEDDGVDVDDELIAGCCWL